MIIWTSRAGSSEPMILSKEVLYKIKIPPIREVLFYSFVILVIFSVVKYIALKG